MTIALLYIAALLVLIVTLAHSKAIKAFWHEWQDLIITVGVVLGMHLSVLWSKSN